jgi:LuxR family maltose regulon positive regulatory protein
VQVVTQDVAEPFPATWPGPDLVGTKLWPPTTRAGLVHRGRLASLLAASLQGKLCLLVAPAGFGKTTLLVQCRAVVGAGRVGWVSLDAGDNDPTRFWTYLIEAVRTVEPRVGTNALEALRRPTADLFRTVLLPLLAELTAVSAEGAELLLVLDDYHLVTNPACHRTLALFLDRLPVGVHVALAGRAAASLPLARMRARGELAEIGAAALRFTDAEAAVLLRDASRGVDLAVEDVTRLAAQTEGRGTWLQLAGLALRGRADPHAFVAAVQATARPVADYLVAEVLERQPAAIQEFLLGTSVLERLSGPLCDAVLGNDNAAALLDHLERSNLFLVPLDEHRCWYRYHPLFAGLLRAELARRDAALIPVLHWRAAAWYRDAGHVEEAIGHASAGGAFDESGALIARYWLAYFRRGRRATVARWLDGLPEEAILADPSVAFITAWIRGFAGAAKQEVERWLAAAERADDTWKGALPEGISSLAFGVALAHATLPYDDVGRSVQAARHALQLAGPQPSPSNWWMAQAALGHSLYLAGHPAAAQVQLEQLVRQVPPAVQPHAVINALALLSLIAGDSSDTGDDHTARALADRAVALAEAHGLTMAPPVGIAYLALGRALARHGELVAAEQQLGRALELLDLDSMRVLRTLTLLVLASVRHDRGDRRGAWTLLGRARGLIDRFTDPGMLPVLLERTERALAAAPRHGPVGGSLTQRELVVLRQLASWLPFREIADKLYISVNTVRTHVQAVYHKLQVTSRAEAVTRARQLGLLPGSASTHPDRSPPPR